MGYGSDQENSEIHVVFQNGAFCIPKRCVLRSKMVHFAMQNGAFCKTALRGLQFSQNLFVDEFKFYQPSKPADP